MHEHGSDAKQQFRRYIGRRGSVVEVVTLPACRCAGTGENLVSCVDRAIRLGAGAGVCVSDGRLRRINPL